MIKRVLIKTLLLNSILILGLTGCGGGGGGGDTPVGNEQCLGNSSVRLGSPSVAVKSEDGKTPILFGDRGTYVPGELLIKFDEGFSEAQAGGFLTDQGAAFSSIRRMSDGSFSGWVKVTLPAGETVPRAMRRYADQGGVAWVQPNFLYHPTAAPNDTVYGNLWGLNNTGQTVNGTTGTAGVDMGMEEAWDTLTDCSTVLVAVIDTGVDYTHNDLLANMWNPSGGVCLVNGVSVACPNHGWDMVDEDSDGAAGEDNDPMDRGGHGTHVTGTIGAVGNNANGITGVCWKAEIMAVRIFPTEGGADTATIIKAIDFAVANGAMVFNMSFGGYGGFDQAYYDAMATIRQAGGIAVVAAGNESTNTDNTPSWPACFDLDNIISVAAMNSSGDLAGFSNFGAQSVDLAAPGTDIESTYPFSVDNTFTEDFSAGWFGFTGTTWNQSDVLFPNGDTYDVLSNPPDALTNTSASYTPSVISNAYKTFDFSGVDIAALSMNVWWDVDDDFFRIYFDGAGGDPTIGGTLLDQVTGNSSDSFVSKAWDLSATGRTANCSIGVQLDANATTGRGVGIYGFQTHARTYDPADNTYKYLQGTSMAAPHVTGLTALVWAQFPTASYREVIMAIFDGGASQSNLASFTCTGARADAPGALMALESILNQ